ncbi:MAG TPA: hypothetical protein VG890_06340 [Puia sp.]|nr:hypothetical protein [Puia sp.]
MTDNSRGLRTVICHLSSVIFFAFLGLSAFAQDSPSVKTTVDKSSIVVGEQLRFGIDVSIPSGMSVQFPQPDTIPHFVIVGKPAFDSIAEPGGMRYHEEWKLTSFDSGLFKIPALPVDIGGRHYFSDSTMVAIGYGSDADSLKDYHDIRGIIDIPNPAVKYIFWILLALTALAVYLFVRYGSKPLMRLIKPEAGKTERPVLGPFEEAMASLDQLKKLPLEDAASIKKYYFGMNDTLRLYLGRSRGLKAMEHTNEELILELGDIGLKTEDYTRLIGALRMSDFVRFAKYLPDQYDNERNLDIIRSSIVLIHEMRN